MNFARLRAHALKRFACLLALVLLLPIAQSFAALHVVSHVQTAEANTSAQTHLVGHNVCDVCLAAVAITGGVLPLKSFDYHQITSPNTLLRVQLAYPLCEFTTPAYESRAPPFARI